MTDGLTWVLQVKPSAAGCKFSASSGRGSGSFRVEQMPDDSSIEIEAVHTYNNGTQLKSNSVRITRGKAVLEPTLELAPEKLTFDPDDASANTVQVRSNTVWSAVASDEGLVFSPASGENDGAITVTAAPAGKTSVITVTAGEGEQTVTRQVEITCENEIPVRRRRFITTTSIRRLFGMGRCERAAESDRSGGGRGDLYLRPDSYQ